MADSKKFGKYSDLFYEFVPQYTSWGDWCHSPQAYFRGDADIPGSKYNVGFQVFTAPVYLEREPHFHREEEYLIFMGTKLPNVFDFDAEIEFYMGEDLDDMEKIVITKPTIIRVPRGMWHCPLNFKRVDKPVWFQAAFMAGKFGSIKPRTDAEGNTIYVYEGDEVRKCVFDKQKKCDYCGKCFSAFNKSATE